MSESKTVDEWCQELAVQVRKDLGDVLEIMSCRRMQTTYLHRIAELTYGAAKSMTTLKSMIVRAEKEWAARQDAVDFFEGTFSGTEAVVFGQSDCRSQQRG